MDANRLCRKAVDWMAKNYMTDINNTTKNNLDNLAIFGGKPAFDNTLHVGRPNIGNRDQLLVRINDALDRRWLTNGGPFLHELERRIEKLLDVKHCIAMANATIALEVTSRALDLRGEVIVPSFTFIATAHSLQWLGIKPVFCDIDPNTHNLDPERVEELITPKTSGILGVHVWGRACAVDKLSHISKRYNLHLLYDAAHAFGASYQDVMIGNFGDAEIFSFHATKFFNTFEGGAVVTNNDDLAARIRAMRNFGFKNYDEVSSLGTNAKMNEISAAMGITGLESLDRFISVNQQNYEHYRHWLSNIPGVKIVQYNETEKNNFQYIVVEIDEVVSKISRDAINDILHAENVLSRRYFYPGCHQMEPYCSNAETLPDLNETESLTQKVLQLPTGTAVSEKEIERVCEIIRYAVHNGLRITQRLN